MSMKKMATFGLAVAPLLIAAGAGWLVLRNRERPAASASTGFARAPFPPGQQQRWTLNFEVQLESPDSAPAVRFTLGGDWVCTVSATREGERDVAYEIADLRITSRDLASPAEVETLQLRLGRRFWVTYRNDGVALRVHFPRNLDPSDRNLLQMIVTATQWVRADKEQTNWTAVERDAAGSYLASYQRNGLNQLIKRKLKYLEVNGAVGAQGPEGVQIQMDQSESRLDLTDAGELAAFDGSERMRLGMPMGQGGWLEIRTATRLANLRVGKAAELAGSLELARAELVSGPIRTQEPDPAVARARRERRLLEGHTIQELFAAAKSHSEAPELPARLAALFSQQEQAIPAALAVIRESKGLKLMTDALAAAGTVPALDALSRLAHDSSSPVAVRVDALTAYVQVQHPSVAAMRVCRDLLTDREPLIRRAAQLTEGALARAGRSDHPAEAAALDEELLSLYAGTREPQTRVELLSALGNSVGPSVLSVLEAALSDALPQVRAAAARALRLAPSLPTDRLLASAITGDPDPTVRSAAIFAVGFRSIVPFVEPLLRAAQRDDTEYVRGAAVALLRRNQEASPKIPKGLAWVAEHDPKPGVRRSAKEAVAKPRHGG
jgi:hypothetical protein